MQQQNARSSTWTESDRTLDAYMAGLQAAQPLDREQELQAGKRIEQAERELLEAILDSGLALPRIVTFRDELERGRLELDDLVVRSELKSTQGPQWLFRRLDDVRKLERRLENLRAELATRGLGNTRRSEVREQIDDLLDRRNRILRRIPLNRTRLEEVVLPAENQLKRLMDQSETPLHETGRTRGELKSVWRRLRKARRQLDREKAHLTQANLRLVVNLAKRMRHRGVGFGDLIQEGNLGLMRAVDKYDYRVGTRFSTYAAWWIRQAMTRLVIAQSCDVRVPVHMSETVHRTRETARQLGHVLGREPTTEEVADALECPVQEARRALEATPRTTSMDAPVSGEEDEDRRLGELLADTTVPAAEDAVLGGEQRNRLLDVLDALAPREQEIIRMRYGLEQDTEAFTLQQIGDRLGLSRERIRQIESSALDKLRHALQRAGVHGDSLAA
jgi:RNA polymerase primary sigma factor